MVYLNGTFAKALEDASARWLDWFRRSLARRGDTPRARLLAIWDALEEWFESDQFYGSTITNAAARLQDHPEHPGHRIIAAHRRAVRRLLEELAEAAGAFDPAGLAGQLLVLMEGAIVGAVVDRQPEVARIGRDLTRMALGGQAA
jgi:AcrR family transcriptional regulator